MRVVASKSRQLQSSFLSVEKDLETIWRKLFIEDRKNGDYLKRLLVLNVPDCLDETQEQYTEAIKSFSIKKLDELGYIRSVPKLAFGEHEEVKSYLLVEFQNFLPTDNPEFRDCIVRVSCISHLDQWKMDNYCLRPYKIAGYVDGLLNGARLSGIGKLEFYGATTITYNEYLGGLVLNYRAVHGSDDIIPENSVK